MLKAIVKPTPRRRMKRNLNFILRIMESFYSYSGGMRAASLAYTVLLSFIPFTISMISVTSWLPFSNSLTKEVEKYIFTTFLPNTGSGIYQQVKVLLHHSQRLSILGFFFLILTTYFMLLSIEKHINELWQNKRQATFASSILIDSLFIIISPLIFCTTMYLRILSLPLISSVTINDYINHFITYLVTITTFVLVYKYIPSKKVYFKHALIAGVVAGSFFEILKLVFILYCNNFFANYNLLYGSLASFPLFLIWIYMCTLNLLFCAEIIYVLENKPTKSTHKRIKKYLQHLKKPHKHLNHLIQQHQL